MAVDAAVTLEARTASATTIAEATASVAVTLRRRTATSSVSSGNVASVAVEREPYTAQAAGPDSHVLVRKRYTASAVALNGTLASVSVRVRNRQVSARSRGANVAVVEVELQKHTASAVSSQQNIASVNISLLRRKARAHSLTGSVATAAVTRKKFEVDILAFPVGVATVAITAPYRRAKAFSQPTIEESYRAWAMNMANEALSEYTNFSFNSFTEFNGKYYGAGPNGLYELDGVDDEGTNIDWTVKTGFLDNKVPNLKRLNEILFALRYNGPIRVRVYTDEETYYDYTLANYREDLIHQTRVKTGKGLRSRYFQVELSSMQGSSVELDSLQLPMEPVSRRIG